MPRFSNSSNTQSVIPGTGPSSKVREILRSEVGPFQSRLGYRKGRKKGSW